MLSANASPPALHGRKTGSAPLAADRVSNGFNTFRERFGRIARSFGTTKVRLTRAQRLHLERDLLDTLRRRAPYWIATVVTVSVVVLWLGAPATERPPGPVASWFGPGFITKPIWTAVLWLLLCPYFPLARRTAAFCPETTLDRVKRIHACWCLWITLVMLWWLFGYWTLMPSPEPIRVFVFGQRPFIFFALILHAAAITMLATSRMSITIGMGGGYILPFALLIGRDWHLPFSYIQVIALAVIFMVLGWLIGTDQRRLRARSILIETERERANRFIATISHDLRQPITTLRMRLRNMTHNAPPQMLPDIRVLDSQTEAIITMVEGTLDLARLEAGTWQVKPRETPLPFILDRIKIDQFAEAAAQNVQLVVNAAPSIVWTDAAAMDRILRNFIANAVRYAREQADGSPSVVLVSCDINGPLLRINVADNGAGIPASKLEDIFSEYVQLANPERDRTKGFGLGLSIVKGLADRMGHKISVSSVFGQGSIFSVDVPNLGHIPPELMPALERGGETPDLTGMVAAVVDDDSGPRRELRTLLIEWGVYVVDGESSDEVIAQLRDRLLPAPPHIIICDYRLRDYRNGTEAVQEIRTAIGAETPAAIWTAETSPSVLREIAANGFSHFAKPPDETALLALLLAHRPDARPDLE